MDREERLELAKLSNINKVKRKGKWDKIVFFCNGEEYVFEIKQDGPESNVYISADN